MFLWDNLLSILIATLISEKTGGEPEDVRGDLGEGVPVIYIIIIICYLLFLFQFFLTYIIAYNYDKWHNALFVNTFSWSW